MKVKHLSLNLLIILFICIIFNLNLFSAEKRNDPITNSYIINNLQMESNSDPSISDQESGEGEIIFDNSFDDNFSKKTKPEITGDTKNKLKKISGSDKRFHLIEYRIKHNENLWQIAKKSNTSLNMLIEINNIKNPNRLKENDLILIPSKKGIFYKIRKGDTLTKISQKFKTEIDVIAEHNNIDGRKIIAGRKIFLPEAVEPVREVPAKIKKYERAEKNTEQVAVNDKTKEKSSSGKVVLAWPLRGPVTSGFGIRTHPFSGDKKFHCGLDIGAEEGTVVKSAGDGTVIFSGWKDAYGNMIVISHKNNYLTIYAHNSKNLVDVNEKIKKGQKIGLSGKTGAVTGAHLHFEIRKGIVPLNPLRILK
ncbi:MAG TPA: M23 family metallopeptidase [Spirochaetota bacterium]|nr:M23 family metallopeptidase [Spirochaetota bacterium]